MPTLALDTILAPISGDDPCGVDLEYDPAFIALQQAAKGKLEQQIGSTIVPAEEPDWKAVQRLALELLARSKDLRTAAYLTRALLRTGGWSGFSQGLSLLRMLVDSFWTGVYPRLDPDDGNDPEIRVNVLKNIADGETVTGVRGLTLVSSRTLGRFSLKDLEIASGDWPAPATGSPPTMASLDGAALDCDLAILEETTAAVAACAQALTGLEASIGALAGASSGVNYGASLLPLVRKASIFLNAKLALRKPTSAGVDPSDATMDGGGDGGGQAAGNGAGRAVRSGMPGEITSREDVVRALERISAYYDKHEPSSPIPLFMARCKRLVMMSFIDIVRELVPDAVSQVEVLKGRTE
jgi:type VI secretion system protein ImpA